VLPLARDSFPIAICGLPAGRPYEIAIFEAANHVPCVALKYMKKQLCSLQPFLRTGRQRLKQSNFLRNLCNLWPASRYIGSST
jgi:hypothetical protein